MLADGALALTLSLLHSVLVHETSESVLSVCFNPDGKLLATGARDGAVRVSSRTFMVATVITVVIVFKANAQHRTASGTLDLGHCQEANPQHIPGSHPVDLLARFLVGREIDRLRVVRWYDENLGYDG